MKRSINLKIEEEFYEEMKSYASAKGGTITTMARAMVMHGFFDSLSSDQSEVKRLERMLEEADKFGLTNRDKADMEVRMAQLKILNERYGELFNDLAAELYGKEDEENA